jgi:hypothetical protein
MRRLMTLTATAVLLAASPAAAQWGEAPPVALGAQDVATCLRDAGGGRVAALAQRGERFGTALHTVTPDGLRPDGEVLLGRSLVACPAVAAAESGAAVTAAALYAGTAMRPGGVRLVAAVRGAGGDFAAPVDLGRVADLEASIMPSVAIAPDGTVAVAWLELHDVFGFDDGRTTLRVARRPPGGGFGPVETIGRDVRGPSPGGPPALAFDAAGSLTLAWARPRPARGRVEGLASVEVVTVAPGAPFGGPQVIAREAQDVAEVALAVAPDGSALLAHDGNEAVQVLERTGAAAPFAAGERIGGEPERSAARPAVALAADGGAVVAWRDGYGTGVHATAREPAGAFGAPTRLEADVDDGPTSFSILARRGGPPLDDDDRVRVAAAPGGRALVGWRVRGAAFGAPAAIRVAQRSATGFGAVRLGSPVRDADGFAPWLGLPEPAVVWTDNRTDPFAFDTYPTGGGRLHLSRPPAASAGPPAPAIAVRVKRRALYPSAPLILDVACAAACDLRAVVAPRGGRRRTGEWRGGAIATGGRSTPGRVRLAARPSTAPIAPRGGGPIRILVRATAPNGTAVAQRSLRARVRRRTPPPLQRPVGLRARRAGDDVIVTWRTAGPARRMSFLLSGHRRRDGTAPRGRIQPSAYRPGNGDRRFRARLRDAGDVRWVAVLAAAADLPRRTARAWVRVR